MDDYHEGNTIYLTMHMNRSPCGDCAESLIEFKNRLKDRGVNIIISIKAAKPYMCKRINCSYCVEDGLNSDGLRKLNRNGISVNAWVWNLVWSDWKFLADYLNGLPFSGNSSVTLNYDEIICEHPNTYNHFKLESRSMADQAAQVDFNAFR